MQVGEQQTKERKERYKFLQQGNRKLIPQNFCYNKIKEAWEILKQKFGGYTKKRSANLSSSPNKREGNTI